MAKPFSYCPMCAAALADREIEGEARRACPECSYVNYNNPTPVVAAIVQYGDDVVLVQNKGWPGSWFGLVSGFLEACEDPAVGVLREVEEELGLKGDSATLVGAYNFPQMNQVVIAYHVIATGDVVVGDELEAIKKVPFAKLRPWPGATGEAVADWLASR